MWWIMIWVLLLLGAGVYLGACAWGLWGRTKELGSELATAQRRLDEVQGQLELVGERASAPEELAVFAEPARVRNERVRARAVGRHARQVRRSGARPAWAKHLD